MMWFILSRYCLLFSFSLVFFQALQNSSKFTKFNLYHRHIIIIIIITEGCSIIIIIIIIIIWDTETPMGLWYTNGSLNLGQKTRHYDNNNKKKKICKIVDFAVPADHKIKLKEREKRDKYLDLTRELKKLWNMKVTIRQLWLVLLAR